jgi:alkanesulfonate monooxygenase SsuD/methylene tetrahydromethanopterin reductase-like flavin-dependent oxidoreductase (luciferase family)
VNSVLAVARLGYHYLCANDHLVFGRPWLDGPTALAALDILSGGPAAGRPPRRRLAGLGLQHHPDRFREGLDRLAQELRRAGKAPEVFPAAIATTWLHVVEDRRAAERVVPEVLAPMLHRPAEALRAAPLLVGPVEVCAERLAAFVAAGARRVFVWPLGDELRQLELFRERVAALI